MDFHRRLRGRKAARAAKRHAEYLIWHDGLPPALLGGEGEGSEGAVMVERYGGQWAVYRKRGAERQDFRLHADAAAAYEDAVARIWKICEAEGL